MRYKFRFYFTATMGHFVGDSAKTTMRKFLGPSSCSIVFSDNTTTTTPLTLIPQHSTLKTQLSSLNTQHSILNPQPFNPSTINPQPRPSTLNPLSSTLNPQTAALNPLPSTLNPSTTKPTSNNLQDSTLTFKP